jgi:hypothetical protein
MPAIGLLAQHARAIERVAGPLGPMELEALAVAASPVTAGAREDCLQVIPGCLVGPDDPRTQRRIPHADILPQAGGETKVDPAARLRQRSGMSPRRVCRRIAWMGLSPPSEPPHPLLLLRRLDGVVTIGGTNPSDGFSRRDAREDSHAGEHCPRAAATAETADLDEFTSTRAGKGSGDLLCCDLRMLG